MNSKKIPRFLIGIDEAGRGPLAGPVAVGAFVLRKIEKNLKNVQGGSGFEKTYASGARGFLP